MTIRKFETRIFGANSNYPKLATITGTESLFDSSFKSRTIRVGDVESDGTITNSGKRKVVRTCEAYDFTVPVRLGDTSGAAEKLVFYHDFGRVSETVIAKNFESKELGKGNFAYLKRRLQDGDVIELTMKQGKNGKYEPVVIKSAKNKLLSELPKVKQMLLKLDPLVKRFIKVAK